VNWFMAVIFLIFNGNAENSIGFFRKFIGNDKTHVACVWPGVSSGTDFVAVANTQIVRLVDEILETELPRFVASLTTQGVTASNFCIIWLNQCFVNVLDWPEICNYVTLAVVGGVKYQAFFCCCVCHQICDVICTMTHDRQGTDIHSFLAGPIAFRLHRSARFLSYLSDKYDS